MLSLTDELVTSVDQREDLRWRQRRHGLRPPQRLEFGNAHHSAILARRTSVRKACRAAGAIGATFVKLVQVVRDWGSTRMKNRAEARTECARAQLRIALMEKFQAEVEAADDLRDLAHLVPYIVIATDMTAINVLAAPPGD